MSDINQKSLEWLYKKLKRAKIDLAHAENKCKDREPSREIENLKMKIEIFDHLIEMVLKEA